MQNLPRIRLHLRKKPSLQSVQMFRLMRHSSYQLPNGVDSLQGQKGGRWRHTSLQFLKIRLLGL